MNYSFPRYLAAKKTVDDRALNRTVWNTLAAALPTGRLDVLEIGAGIGTMVERAIDWNLLHEAHYTALDALPENIAAARERLSDRGFRSTPQGLSYEGVTISLLTADLFAFVEQASQHWDLLIAHAFLDLVDMPTTLPPLFRLLRPGGLAYLTINFDGVTILEPAVDPELDEVIPRLYHRTMDERLVGGRSSGDCRAGRRLFANLKAAGGQILAAGASDWVVYAGPGGYPADEAYFLHFIIHTIDTALKGHPALEPGRFAQWIAARYAQIERRELVYIAHQLDFLARRPG